MDNRDILRKADLAVSDLQSDGGYLVPEQAAKLLGVMIKEGRMLSLAKVVPMTRPEKLIEKTNFATRIMRAGASKTALTVGERAKLDLYKVSLQTKLFKAQVDLDDEVLEDSIERNDLRNTVLSHMAKATARDIDEVVIQGDTASVDTFLAQFDGIIKQAVTNVNAAGGVALTKDVLRDTLKALPQEFRGDRRSLKFLTSSNAEIDWRDSTSNRETQLGDRNVVSAATLPYNGIEVLDIPMFPENLGVGTNETVVLLLNPKNIHIGVQRAMRIKTDEDIEAGVFKIVMTMRMDMKYEHEPAVAKATEVIPG